MKSFLRKIIERFDSLDEDFKHIVIFAPVIVAGIVFLVSLMVIFVSSSQPTLIWGILKSLWNAIFSYFFLTIGWWITLTLVTMVSCLLGKFTEWVKKP